MRSRYRYRSRPLVFGLFDHRSCSSVKALLLNRILWDATETKTISRDQIRPKQFEASRASSCQIGASFRNPKRLNLQWKSFVTLVEA